MLSFAMLSRLIMEQEFYFSHQQQALGSDLFTLVIVAKEKRKEKKMYVARTYSGAARVEIRRFFNYRCLYDTEM